MPERRTAAQLRAQIEAERQSLREDARSFSADAVRAARAAGAATATLAGSLTLLRVLLRLRRRHR